MKAVIAEKVNVSPRVVSGKATVELTVKSVAAGTRTVVGRARVDLTAVAK